MHPGDDLAATFAYYPRLRKVKEHIDQQIEEQISLAKAAEIAGLERKYFSSFFREKTGICFRDWLAYARVKRAVEMMSHQDDTVTSIAGAVGFQDLRSFERAFKRWTGMNPSAYKNSIRPRRGPHGDF